MAEMKTKERKPKQQRSSIQDMPPPASVVGLMNRHQVCKALGGVCLRKLTGMISTGEFPRPDVRIGDSPRWSVAMFNAWVESKRASVKG